MELDKIYCGDCLEILPTFPDKSVDLIITDPPYNIGKAHWDKIEDYDQWCAKWIVECERILKDNGSFYFFHNDMLTAARLICWIQHNTAFILKQFIVWNKRFEGSRLKSFFDIRLGNNSSRNYKKMAEYILFYTFQDGTGLSKIHNTKDCFTSIKKYMRNEKKKSGLTHDDLNLILGGTRSGSGLVGHYLTDGQWMLPTAEMYAKLQTTGYFQKPYEELRKEYEELRYTFNVQRTHHSVWDYDVATKNGHPTVKPVDLISNIISHSSNENNVVLDCFMGSGATTIACIETGRQYIGIEISPLYCEIAERRIAAARQQPKLPGL